MRPFRQMLTALGDRLSTKNPGLIGAGIAFAFALLIVIFGFLRTLFILVLTIAGYYAGVRWFSNREAIKNLLDKIFPPGLFR